jgi:transcriptional regulator with XRE-family HTH domain
MTKRRVLGLAIRAIREALGLTQQQLADLVGGTTTRPYIANIEAGRKQPSEEVVTGICRALSIPKAAITYPECGCQSDRIAA